MDPNYFYLMRQSLAEIKTKTEIFKSQVKDGPGFYFVMITPITMAKSFLILFILISTTFPKRPRSKYS